MKIVIYAAGQIFERYQEQIKWGDIIAICDKKTDDLNLPSKIDKIPVVSPDMLSRLEYDFIAVFSNIYFEEIKMELVGEYFVPKKKIISWRDIIKETDGTTMDALVFFSPFFREKNYKRFLDIGMSSLAGKYLSKKGLLLEEDAVLDGIPGEAAIHNQSLYDNIYSKWEACKESYDVIFISDETFCEGNRMDSMLKRAKNIIYSRRRDITQNGRGFSETLCQYGKERCISTAIGDYLLIDTESRKSADDISIFVVTHKKYHLYSDEIYIPLCVGDYQEKGYLTEQKGKNISYLNRKINECTALYWIWKNTDKEIVGLNHYRRYFFNNGIKSMDNYLDSPHIHRIMETYDIILPAVRPLEQMTMYEQIENSMNRVLCRTGYSIMRRKIGEKQPEYVSAFDSVMEGHAAFNCNLFVAKRQVLNQYCEWLFSFLIEAAEEINVEGYDSYSQRVIGFYAERMWTVWLRKNPIRIKELPYVLVG